MEPAKSLKLSLLENAYSYLNASLDNVVKARTSNDQLLWKFAILNITLSIELFLKERLRREHPLLIYSNIDSYRPFTLDTRTASWTVLIERLRYVLGDQLSKVDAGRLHLAGTLRNRIIHYEVELEFPSVYHTFANLHNFVVEFFENFLRQDDSETLRDHIRADLWPEEQGLFFAFADQIVFYNGIFMTTSLRDEIEHEQPRTHLLIQGTLYERIKYGSPQENPEFTDQSYADRDCHDCGVVRGQIHSSIAIWSVAPSAEASSSPVVTSTITQKDRR
jgi:hypothetical protein